MVQASVVKDVGRRIRQLRTSRSARMTQEDLSEFLLDQPMGSGMSIALEDGAAKVRVTRFGPTLKARVRFGPGDSERTSSQVASAVAGPQSEPIRRARSYTMARSSRASPGGSSALRTRWTRRSLFVTVPSLSAHALAPVGDGTGDQQLAIGERADLGRGGCAGRSACGRAYRALGGPVAMGALSRSLPAFLVAEAGRTGQVPDPQRDRALGHAEGGGDLLEVQALCAQSAGALAQVVLGSGPAGPLRRRLALESVVERGVAHRAEDLLDLPPGFTLPAELDSTFPQGGHFLSSAHIRILVRASDIRPLENAHVRELHEISALSRQDDTEIRSHGVAAGESRIRAPMLLSPGV